MSVDKRDGVPQVPDSDTGRIGEHGGIQGEHGARAGGDGSARAAYVPPRLGRHQKKLVDITVYTLPTVTVTGL